MRAPANFPIRAPKIKDNYEETLKAMKEKYATIQPKVVDRLQNNSKRPQVKRGIDKF